MSTSSAVLFELTCRVDVTSSLLFDLEPSFPVPLDLVPSIQGTLPTPLLNIMKIDADMRHFMSCLADLNAVAAFIESTQAAKGEIMWKDDESMGLWINPVAHRLLTRAGTQDSLSESLRLGAIVWVVWVKRRYRSYPGTSSLHVSRLLKLMSGNAWKSSGLVTIRLWLLVLCGIVSSFVDERSFAVDMLVREARPRDWQWPDVMTRVRTMPWIGAFEAPCKELRPHFEVHTM